VDLNDEDNVPADVTVRAVSSEFDGNGGQGLEIDEFATYVKIVERARRQWADRIDVRLGLEADYFPGYEDFLRKQVEWADFHYVIGSVHPQLPEYKERYDVGDPFAFQQTYFRLLAEGDDVLGIGCLEKAGFVRDVAAGLLFPFPDHLVQAAETELFDCLAHPDLVKNFTPLAWRPADILPEICRNLDRIAAAEVAMELNTSGANKSVAEMNPFPEMLMHMQQRAIAVVIGGDAHEPGRVGEGFLEALDLLEQAGYRQVTYFLDRQRHDVSIDQARASLVQRQLQF